MQLIQVNATAVLWRNVEVIRPPQAVGNAIRLGVDHILQIRIHGRGGQGVVTAAEMLSVAAFFQGRHAQAFPSFGSERTGAPVVAFCRIDDRPIRLREPIQAPDVLIVQDAHLLQQIDVFQGLDPKGHVLINTRRSLEDLGLTEIAAQLPKGHVVTLPATEIAMKHLGRPLPNAVLLGGFAAMTGIISLAAVVHAIGEKFHGDIARRNVAAATEAHAMLADLEAAR
ncbi:2-oxoacid:acceptor oxidoreductase family protein [Rhodobacter ferrooxidans]|uniref:Pyruvate/ketoisovalerate oxidoreductase, gamma subunit n=1 Tax=Rhodobacter ferrooxidans TaxID=371731 RepID=C8S4C1_9RHOB|nr:2-oxoacid:acceptor oxidoreductase family protein [Rhodobacter sp. SW2]EEW24180.1 pyruvate/ketoisovalerate oxidoreductase, gamma subunit [Rhodobacter sp. SW2]